MLTVVVNLLTLEESTYSLPPRDAVIAGHAQMEKNDWETWDYEKKYASLVKFGQVSVICGNCSALLEGATHAKVRS